MFEMFKDDPAELREAVFRSLVVVKAFWTSHLTPTHVMLILSSQDPLCTRIDLKLAEALAGLSWDDVWEGLKEYQSICD